MQLNEKIINVLLFHLSHLDGFDEVAWLEVEDSLLRNVVTGRLGGALDSLELHLGVEVCKKYISTTA